MLIDKIIIHKQDRQIISLCYAGNKLFTVLHDNEDIPSTESVFIGKLTRVNQANSTAFIEYGNGLNGFINLHKNSAYQVGSTLCTQLTWLGNETKQAKLRPGFELIGKYIIYHKASSQLSLKAKHLNDTITSELKAALSELTGTWIIRSNIQNLNKIAEVITEAKQLSQQAQTINELVEKISTVSCLHNGTSNYLKIVRELELAENCEIITNDTQINEQLIAKQDIWQIDAATYDSQIKIEQDLAEYDNQCQQKIVYTTNNTAIEYGTVAGIHIFDINNNNTNQSHAQTNFDAIELIYQQIILRNLQGIILLDIIKNISIAQEQKILQKLIKLFKQDISHTQILGISQSGLVELVRNKY